ncbi:MAG TPA: hypothetical protein VF453_11935 [Burkholderiaceae bacterium]
MDVLAMLLVCAAIAFPMASVLIAARLWRAKLARPARFKAVGLTLLYLFTGYLLTRPVPTHAVAIEPLDFTHPVENINGSVAVRSALLLLVEVAASSIAVVLLLRRIMSR